PVRRRRLPAAAGRAHPRRPALPAVLRHARDQLRGRPAPRLGAEPVRPGLAERLRRPGHLPLRPGAVLLPPGGQPDRPGPGPPLTRSPGRPRPPRDEAWPRARLRRVSPPAATTVSSSTGGRGTWPKAGARKAQGGGAGRKGRNRGAIVAAGSAPAMRPERPGPAPL